jgi:hypothetical protein
MIFDIHHKTIFMADSNRNRNSIKDTDKKKGNRNSEENSGNRKLPDNPQNDQDETISTRGDTSQGKYSKTNKRDEDIDNDDTRGGR